MPQRIEADEVQTLPTLSGEQRADALIELSRRVAGGETDNAALPLLVQMATDENEPSTRDAWLAYIGASRSPEFIPVLEKWLTEPDEDLRLATVAALAWIVTPRTNEILLHLVQSDKSSRIRRHALRYLVRRASLGEWEPVDLLAVVQESDWRPVTKREYLKLMRRPE